MTINNANFGFRVPDVVANLRVDQAWGFAGISAALHDASGAYYATPNVRQQRPSRRQVRLGVGGRCQVQPAGRRHDRLQRLLLRRRGRHLHQPRRVPALPNSDSVGLGWIADGVFANGTQIELTKVWSALAAYEHIWNPKWRTAVGGGYVNVDYNGTATNMINAQLPGCGPANCGVVAAGAALTAFTPASATAAVRTTASGKPIPAPSGTRCRSSISVCR